MHFHYINTINLVPLGFFKRQFDFGNLFGGNGNGNGNNNNGGKNGNGNGNNNNGGKNGNGNGNNNNGGQNGNGNGNNNNNGNADAVIFKVYILKINVEIWLLYVHTQYFLIIACRQYLGK